MCLIVFALGVRPDLPLVVLANRDELHARPSDRAHAWADAPTVFGGRDRVAGGTWLGVTTGGRFAAVTNVRSPAARTGQLSRGQLVREALVREEEDLARWGHEIARPSYSSFNLLFGDAERLFVASEDQGEAAAIAPGLHGLSNARLDVRWPKVEHTRDGLASLLRREGDLDVEGAFALLADRARAPDEALPQTGVPLAVEQALSPAFVLSETYGTRASTVVAFHADGRIRVAERTFDPRGVAEATTDVTLRASSGALPRP